MSLMRYRINRQADGEMHTIACAGTHADAEACAAVLSAQSVVAIVDFTSHEDPEVRSWWRNGRKVS